MLKKVTPQQENSVETPKENFIIATYDNKGYDTRILGSEFDLSNVKEMYIDEKKCKPVDEIYEGGTHTVKIVFKENATDMSDLFCWCESLRSLDLSNFDTSKVENMSGMFEGCESLTSLDLSNFDTSKVEDMWRMFQYCKSLKSLDLSNFDTSKVKDMHGMFFSCESLTNLDLSNFNTGNVTSMWCMFYNCDSLESLDLNNFDTSKVSLMDIMFSNCKSLKSLDLSNFDTKNVESMGGMFYRCNELQSLKMGRDVSAVKYLKEIFDGMGSSATGNKILYYPSKYDYSKIIKRLPYNWTAEAYNLKEKKTKKTGLKR